MQKPKPNRCLIALFFFTKCCSRQRQAGSSIRPNEISQNTSNSTPHPSPNANFPKLITGI